MSNHTSHIVNRMPGEKLGLDLNQDDPGLIKCVSPEGACAREGMIPFVGDRIVEVNNQLTVGMTHKEITLLINSKPADTDDLKLVTMAARPAVSESDDTILIQLSRNTRGKLGFAIKSVDSTQVTTNADTPGLPTVISNVHSDSVFYSTKLEVGDVLLEVDGASIVKMTHREKLNALGLCGDRVMLLVRREKLAYTYTQQVTVHRDIGERLGLDIAERPDKDGSVINGIRDMGPCARSGKMRTGDLVVAVDDISLEGKDHADTLTLFGNCGQTVHFTLVSSKSFGADDTGTISEDELHTKKRYINVIRNTDESLGLKIRSEPNTMGACISLIKENTPASQAKGLRLYDVLYEIDGRPAITLHHSEILSALQAAGNSLSLVVATREFVENDKELKHLILSRDDSSDSNNKARSTVSTPNGSEVLSDASRFSAPYAFTTELKNPNPDLQGRDDDTIRETDRESGSAMRRITVTKTGSGQKLGMKIARKKHKRGIHVTFVDPNQACGQTRKIFVGDVIVEIDGEQVLDKTQTEVTARLNTRGAHFEMVVADSESVENLPTILSSTILSASATLENGFEPAIPPRIIPRPSASHSAADPPKDDEIDDEAPYRKVHTLTSSTANKLHRESSADMPQGNFQNVEAANKARRESVGLPREVSRSSVSSSPSVSKFKRNSRVVDPANDQRSSFKNKRQTPMLRRVTVERRPGEKLGMKIRTKPLSRGVRVSSVVDDGPCDRSGQILEGDIILMIDGENVLDQEHKYVLDFISSRIGDAPEFVLCAPADVDKAAAVLEKESKALALKKISESGFNLVSGFAGLTPLSDNTSKSKSSNGFSESPYLIGNTMSRNGMAISNKPSSMDANDSNAHNAQPMGGLNDNNDASLQTDNAVSKSPYSNDDLNTDHIGNQKTVTVSREPNERIGMKIRSYHGVKGVRVSEVTPGGPIERTGKVQLGDIIVSINDRQMLDLPHKDVLNELKGCGSTFTLVVRDPNPSKAAGPPSTWRTFSCQKHVTTRPQNSSDVDYYYFISSEDFELMKDAELFDTNRKMAGFAYGSFHAHCLCRNAHTSLSASETLFPRTSLGINRCTVELNNQNKDHGLSFTPKEDILAPVVQTISPQGIIRSQCDVEEGDIVFFILNGKITDPRLYMAASDYSQLPDNLELFVIRENPTNLEKSVNASAPSSGHQNQHGSPLDAQPTHARAPLSTVAKPAGEKQSQISKTKTISYPDTFVRGDAISEPSRISSGLKTDVTVLPIERASPNTRNQPVAVILNHSQKPTVSERVEWTEPAVAPVHPDETDALQQEEHIGIAKRLSDYRLGKQPAEQCLVSIENIVSGDDVGISADMDSGAEAHQPSAVEAEAEAEALELELRQKDDEIQDLKSRLEKKSSDLWIQRTHVSALQEALDSSRVVGDDGEDGEGHAADLGEGEQFEVTVQPIGAAVLDLPVRVVIGQKGVLIDEGMSQVLAEASTHNLHAGDQIIGINGQSCLGIDSSVVIARLSVINPATEFTMRIHRPVDELPLSLNASPPSGASANTNAPHTVGTPMGSSDNAPLELPSYAYEELSVRLPETAIDDIASFEDGYIEIADDAIDHTDESTDVAEVIRALGLEMVTLSCKVTRNDAESLGVVVYSDDGVKGILIEEVVPNSPADLAGLKVRDYILMVDGKDVSKEWYDDVVSVIKQTKNNVHFVVSRVVKPEQTLKAINFTVSKKQGDPLGAKLYFHATHTSVIEIQPSSAADRAGLKVTDRIVAIEKVKVGAMANSEIMQRLGSMVYTLTVERLCETKPAKQSIGYTPQQTFG